MSRFSLTEIVREREWRRCKGTSNRDLDACLYWMRTHTKIQHPERGAITFPVRPLQAQILATWMVERYSIVLKARQIGWSTLVAVYALWLSVFWDDQVIVMLSKTERDAEKLLAKSIYAYERLPQWMRDRGPHRKTKNMKDITFDNGSKIESLPSKEDPARGSAVTLVVCDEWAFFDDPEGAWASVEPITDIGGRVIGLSTANGWGDFFHQTWVKARAGISQFTPMFFPWNAVTERDEQWYADKKSNMLEWQLHQEYPSNEQEAFIKSGRPVFDVDALNDLIVSEPRRGALITHQPGSPKAPHFNPENLGRLSVWEMPKMGAAYVIGADVAEGLDHGDYSSAHVIEVATGLVVATYHAHVDADVFGDRLAELGYFYNVALIGIEVNNHGLTTCKAVQRASYPRIYFRRNQTTRSRELLRQIGWRTDVTTKPLMIDELARALREGSIGLEDTFTIAELMQYVRDERGRTNGSPFDDRVISLAIAVQMLHHASTPEFKATEDDYGTWNYFFRKVTEPQGGEYVPIGVHNVRSNN